MGKHIPVLLNESIEGLNIKADGIYVDCTLGGGGHSSAILAKLTTGHLYSFDQDQYAIKVAEERLKEVGSNFTIINSNFEHIKSELLSRGITSVDGILYDLGVSSFQFDIPSRGFSYNYDAYLDMRMNQEATLDAYYVVNNYSEEELRKILFEYGEEKFARNIARLIVRERATKPIRTTFELVDIIKKSLPAAVKRNIGHPAKQTFQALRIEVNGELKVLKKSLEDALELLNSGGRVAVISFHSLEDRIVKQIFKKNVTLDLPKGLPFIPQGYEIKYRLINNKVIVPTTQEVEENNRSRTAKLRIIERI